MYLHLPKKPKKGHARLFALQKITLPDYQIFMCFLHPCVMKFKVFICTKFTNWGDVIIANCNVLWNNPNMYDFQNQILKIANLHLRIISKNV